MFCQELFRTQKDGLLRRDPGAGGGNEVRVWIQIVVDVPDALGRAGHAIVLAMNEHVDDDLAAMLPQGIDNNSISQIVRHPMNKPPAIVDQECQLKTMLGGAFVLGDNHGCVF